MSTNYYMLKEGEKIVFTMFEEKFEELIKMLEYTSLKFKDKYDANDLFDECLKFDKKMDISLQDIADECIWSIQKNEPKANHLRFFIALINSCSNLKRMSAYIVNFAKFYRNEKDSLTAESVDDISVLYNLSIVNIKKLFIIFKNKGWNKDAETVTKIFNDFLKIYKKDFDSIVNLLFNKKYKSIKFLPSLIVVLKNFDRYLDNTLYIFDNFSNF